MTVLSDAWAFARFLGGLPAFLREEMPLDRAREIVRERLAQRGENFLRLMERSVYGYRRSPYRALLRMVGCELGDLRRMVRTDGLEPSLRALREAGVFVTFEEFKGRAPLVRDGQEIPARPEDFDNPPSLDPSGEERVARRVPGGT